MTDAIKQAARDVPALPSNKRELKWTLLWQGGALGIIILLEEYIVVAPLWNHVVLPLWNRLT